MLSNPDPATVFPPSSLNAGLHLEPCGYHWELMPHARSFLDTILLFYSSQIWKLRYGDGECPAQSHSLSQPGPDSPVGDTGRDPFQAWGMSQPRRLSPSLPARPPGVSHTSSWWGGRTIAFLPARILLRPPLLEAHAPPHRSTSHKSFYPPQLGADPELWPNGVSPASERWQWLLSEAS